MRSENKPEYQGGTAKAFAPPLVRFVQLVDSSRPPQRADRSVGGLLPVRALRYCEPVLAASAFGYLVFLPRRFQLLWDGHEIFWRMEGIDTFEPLRQVHYPGFAEAFDAVAPPDARGYAPSFLTASVQPGMLQVWTGSIAVTAPGWSLLVRPVVNLARPSGYELFEGIIETDSWFGPLFTNIRLTRTGVAIEFDDDIPFMQVQPIRQGHYEEARMQNFEVVPDMSGITGDDWASYTETVVKPSRDPERRRGAYAARIRKGHARRSEAAE